MRFAMAGIVTATALFSAGHVMAADGKAVYDKGCAGCHKSMAPKLGDKPVWKPLIAQGVDAMVASVVKGTGAMPVNGGMASASKDDIKAAVDYMMAQGK